MQQIKITKRQYRGSNRTDWNVDLEGRPFGQIWTYKARGERHPYHARALDGRYETATSYQAAETIMRGWM